MQHTPVRDCCAISRPVKGSQWDPLGQIASLRSLTVEDSIRQTCSEGPDDGEVDESALERCGTEFVQLACHICERVQY
jgi:hypothetical protein